MTNSTVDDVQLAAEMAAGVAADIRRLGYGSSYNVDLDSIVGPCCVILNPTFCSGDELAPIEDNPQRAAFKRAVYKEVDLGDYAPGRWSNDDVGEWSDRAGQKEVLRVLDKIAGLAA